MVAFRGICLLIVIFALASPHPAIGSQLQALKIRGESGYTDPAQLVEFINSYEAVPVEKLNDMVGNVIGQLAVMFQDHPERIEDWLSEIDSSPLDVYATVALALCGNQARALAFSASRGITSQSVAEVLTYRTWEKYEPIPPMATLL